MNARYRARRLPFEAPELAAARAPPDGGVRVVRTARCFTYAPVGTMAFLWRGKTSRMSAPPLGESSITIDP